jgi:RimJ/RimL family protein N-acetyltransferase
MDPTPHPVALRPLEAPDADVIAGWAADPEFCREAAWTPDLPIDERRRLHRTLIRSPPPELIRLGAVHNGVLVGYVDLHGLAPTRRELGFVIGERHRWGRGLGRSAAAAGLEFGFARLDLHEIWAEALTCNERSIRVLQRLGLAETGPGENGVGLDRRIRHRRFAITAEDWRAGATSTR